MPVLTVVGTLQVAQMILQETALSFLGLGLPPPTATWGNMLAEGRDRLWAAPWIANLSGLAIIIVVWGINMLGNGLARAARSQVAAAALMALLEVEGLRTVFAADDGEFAAVDDVSFTLDQGEVLGSGRRVRLRQERDRVFADAPGAAAGSRSPAARSASRARTCSRSTRAACARVRGRQMSMIFQEPLSSLNPLYTIGQQVMEPLRLHRAVAHAEARTRAIAMLDRVGIPDAARRFDDYPHQLSGGMRQRVMIAMALACAARSC